MHSSLLLIGSLLLLLVRVGANLYVYVADVTVNVYLGNVCILWKYIPMPSPLSQRHKKRQLRITREMKYSDLVHLNKPV